MNTPTKFPVHMTLNTNMTSDDPKMTSNDHVSCLCPYNPLCYYAPDDPRMTSDDPGSTSKTNLSEWWLHLPSFKFIRSFILIWPQMTRDDLKRPRKYQLKNPLWMINTPPKFQVNVTPTTNMISDDPRWPQNLINSMGYGDTHTHQVLYHHTTYRTWDIAFTRLFQEKWINYAK